MMGPALKLSIPRTPVRAVPRYAFVRKRLRKAEIEGDEGIFYEFITRGHAETAQFILPSVTTVLSQTADKKWLEEWRARIGEEKAAKITHRSAARGTAMHDYLARMLAGEEFKVMQILPTCVKQTSGMHKELEQHLTSYMFSETPMASLVDNVAGTPDVIGAWDYVPSVIDFKNARRIKTEDDILDYFLQTALYSRLLQDMYTFVPNDFKLEPDRLVIEDSDLGYEEEREKPAIINPSLELVYPKQVVILIAQEDGSVQTFIRPIEPYIAMAKERINQWERKN